MAGGGDVMEGSTQIREVPPRALSWVHHVTQGLLLNFLLVSQDVTGLSVSDCRVTPWFSW